MELTNEVELRAHLMQTDPAFRQLSEQHSTYDQQLLELESKSHLSDDEQIEEHRLKKLKLHAKDQMRAMILRHRESSTAN